MTKKIIKTIGLTNLCFVACASFAAETSIYDTMGDVTKGEFISSPFINSASHSDLLGRSPVPQSIQLKLGDHGLVDIIIEEQTTELNRKVLIGSLEKMGQKIPFSEVIIVESTEDKILANIQTSEGNWLLYPDDDGKQLLIKVKDNAINDEVLHAPHSDGDMQSGLSQLGNNPPPSADIDAEGNIVIDIFMGFSERALEYVTDKEAYSVMQIIAINNALENSKIDGIRVRLVGTGTTDQHQGMDWK
jgi:hypothetical protein